MKVFWPTLSRKYFAKIDEHHSYIPLTNRFEVRTVSYGPSFFFSRSLMAQARSARAINRREKRGSVTYSTDRENEVSKIFTLLEKSRFHTV